MQPPRPFRGAQYDKDMFTFLPNSSRDALPGSSRKRKWSAYDHQVPSPARTPSYGFSRTSGPKSNTGDLRDEELRNSIPASPCRSPRFRDYPHKSQSWDRKNYEAPWHSGKRDRHETRSEYAGSSSKGHLQSRYHKDISPVSAGQTHKTSKCPAYRTEDFNRFENHEANEQKARSRNTFNYREFRNWGSQKRVQKEDFMTSCHDQSSKNIGKSQTLHQVLKTGAVAVDIHERDCHPRKASRWSPLMTECVNLQSHVLNAHVARAKNASDFQECCSSGPQKCGKMNIMASSSYNQAFEDLMESQSMQQSPFEPEASAMVLDEKGCQTHKASTWPLSVPEQYDQLPSHESNKERLDSHSQEYQNCGPQMLAQMKVVAYSPHEQAPKNFGGSQSLKQNFLNPGPPLGDFDAKCCDEETSELSSSSVKGTGEASTFTASDNTKTFGDNVGNSECDLQYETNRLLQSALRLLSAASGIVSADNSGGNIQGLNDVNIMKLLLDSGIQNLQNSLVQTTVSKSIEASQPSPNDKSGLNGEKGSIELDGQGKYENKASAFTEKLWAGTLQLSSCVSVSAVAFFKSGERMQDFSWSESVEVKGKVRLEAFEKYVQDLPRSRSRGLMVMSFCCKEGSSNAGLKDMKEVARKYKERKKIGFAQLSSGVDLYICPHSDAVVTILAKHGFFKGMAAVIDKSDPLIGCVVWRKNPSMVPASKTMEVYTAQSSEPSLRSPSDSSAQQVLSENSTVAKKNQEPISMSSVDEGTSKGDKGHEFETKIELDKSNLQPPSVVTEHSAASSTSDDDDLPEYDFGVVSQTSDVWWESQFRDSEVRRSMATQTRSESPTTARTLPDFHFQRLVSQSMGRHSSHSLSLPIEPQKQIRECTESSKPPENHFQGPAPHNRGHMHELQNSSIPIQQQKQTEKCTATSKSSTLFEDDNDDDDIPEWCPPGFTNLGPGVAQEAGPSHALSHPKVPASAFADSASRPLPSLPSTPPPAQLQLRNKEYPSARHLPASLASKPSADGFMHRGPESLPPLIFRHH